MLLLWKGGHKSPRCHHKNRPKEEWAINKATSEELSLSQIGKHPQQPALQQQPQAPTKPIMKIQGQKNQLVG